MEPSRVRPDPPANPSQRSSPQPQTPADTSASNLTPPAAQASPQQGFPFPATYFWPQGMGPQQQMMPEPGQQMPSFAPIQGAQPTNAVFFPMVPPQQVLMAPPSSSRRGRTQADIDPRPSSACGSRAKENAAKKTPPSRKKKSGKDNEKADTRKFTKDDELALIYYWEDHYESFTIISKANFAKKAAEYLNRKVFCGETPTDAEQIAGKIAYLSQRYKKIVDKYEQSGMGLQENDPAILSESLARTMWNFARLHNFLSTKNDILPAHIQKTDERDGGTNLSAKRNYGATILKRKVRDNAERDDSSDGIDEDAETRAVDDRVKGQQHGALVIEDEPDDDEVRPVVKKAKKRGSGQKRKRSNLSGSQNEGGRPQSSSVSRVNLITGIDEHVKAQADKQNKTNEDTLEIMRKDVSLKEKEVTCFEEDMSLKRQHFVLGQTEAQRRKKVETVAALQESSMRYKALEMLDKAKECMERADVY